MVNKTATHTNATATDKASALTKFNLSFEFDRTWAEAKQTVQHRPGKK